MGSTEAVSVAKRASAFFQFVFDGVSGSLWFALQRTGAGSTWAGRTKSEATLGRNMAGKVTALGCCANAVPSDWTG
ncbi:unnamed protein product [Phytophthora lilii]|uniref:Unnamed protein product n=1 Tax=Phytophthora lilii TaxID=2077276 RepID=A0A9W6TAI7_9STRA|nr:unnamed protein product [Phytophthora lilii]